VSPSTGNSFVELSDWLPLFIYSRHLCGRKRWRVAWLPAHGHGKMPICEPLQIPVDSAAAQSHSRYRNVVFTRRGRLWNCRPDRIFLTLAAAVWAIADFGPSFASAKDGHRTRPTLPTPRLRSIAARCPYHYEMAYSVALPISAQLLATYLAFRRTASVPPNQSRQEPRNPTRIDPVVFYLSSYPPAENT